MTDDTTTAAAARAARFGKLPEAPDPARFVVEVPAFPDATPQPVEPPSAAAPDLIAATQLADAAQNRKRSRPE